jgi:hypothetical protein
MPYPTETEWLSGVRLIVPVASGVYGVPGNQIALTSNHQPSLVHLGEMDGVTIFALDGGGFPVEVAAAFGLIDMPADNAYSEYVEFISGSITFYIPRSLAVAWKWKDGDVRLGGTVKVVSDIFPNSQVQGFLPVLIRLYTAVRLALAQLLLLFFPIVIINSLAFIPTAVALLLGACLVAIFWNNLPGNGWTKGGVIGLALSVFVAALNFFQILSFYPLFSIGIFILIVWMGGLFMGSRNPSLHKSEQIEQ